MVYRRGSGFIKKRLKVGLKRKKINKSGAIAKKNIREEIIKHAKFNANSFKD